MIANDCGRAAADPSVPDAEAPVLLAPTLGRPVFVAPGQTFYVTAHIADASNETVFELTRRGIAGPARRLVPEEGFPERLRSGQAVSVRVPLDVPPRTYDLVIRGGGHRLEARHSVAVGNAGRQIRLVHLSNMNVGDLGASTFDPQLVDEVNLVAPTAIIATGDLLDATHPDPATGWLELTEYLARFDAPAIIACGDHDDAALYSRHIAPSPVGMVAIGPHRALVLLDHPRSPIRQDAAQIRWVEAVLGQRGFDGITAIVSHANAPELLRNWQQRGICDEMLRNGRIGLWFSGGHRDWDGEAYRDLVAAADPMLYIKTQQSSPAQLHGASGVSHYRIIDIFGDLVSMPEPEPPVDGVTPSIPVGRLHVTLDTPNDGSKIQLGFSAENKLPCRLDRLSQWVTLRKVGSQKPWCRGARLEQLIEHEATWEFRLGFDLPDKGVLRGMVGVGDAPLASAVECRFDAPKQMHFEQRATADGIRYFAATDATPIVQLRNAGTSTASLMPLIRLDGDPIAYRPAGGEEPYATAYRLRLEPEQTASLQLDMSAVRVAAGRRELQVYLRDAEVMTPFCHPLDIVVRAEPEGSPRE